jgi:hypothetical protein
MSDHTWGFELALTYDAKTRTTTAYYKASKSTQDGIINQLKNNFREIEHPMVIPILILRDNIGKNQEYKQREARDLLYSIKNNLQVHLHAEIDHSNIKGPSVTLQKINDDLVTCHAMIWKKPELSFDILDKFEEAMGKVPPFYQTGTQSKETQDPRAINMGKTHKTILAQLSFIRQRLRGLSSFSNASLSRIEMHRTALHNLLLIRQNATALQIESRAQAEAEQKFGVSQTWNRNQRTISILGIVFLPGAFIAVCINSSKHSAKKREG